MTPKPKTPLTEDERRRAGEQIKDDIFAFLVPAAEAAVMTAAEFIDRNPENLVSQASKHPLVRGLLGTVAVHAKALRERKPESER